MLCKLFNDYVSSEARTKSSDIISAIFSLSQPLGHPDVLHGLLPVGTGSWRQYSTDGEILSWGKEEAWLLLLSEWKKGTEILRPTAMQTHFIVFQPSSHLC